jgi:hypothetical protein
LVVVPARMGLSPGSLGSYEQHVASIKQAKQMMQDHEDSNN